MPIVSEKEQQKIINNIVGSFRLEGLEITEQTIADMHRVNQGELTTEQAIKNGLARIKREEIQQ
ncbi:antitoxin VbhA family protein [Paenalcaligenes sp. Me131]|uniref:antitoxin VbhA family protein n=1 Tax=Paenalcaligenes sp. Me131 TaxID=3392636 RepID=UPI003D2BBEFF